MAAIPLSLISFNCFSPIIPTNSGGITTVTIGYFNGSGVQTAVFPTQTNTDTTLTFYNADGSIILKEKSAVVVENLDWNTSDYKITANAADDITDVKVGMRVSHDNFPIGTTVTNVSGTTIVVSFLPDTAVTSNAGEVTFIDPDGDSSTWDKYKANAPSANTIDDHNYDDDVFDLNIGQRYGLDSKRAHVNGSFFIDDNTGKIYFSLRETFKLITSAFSKRFSAKAGKAEDLLRSAVTGGTLFSSLGFYYIGPIDGHDLSSLIPILKNARDSQHAGPILIHIKMKKLLMRLI